jgi:hypothetical protein
MESLKISDFCPECMDRQSQFYAHYGFCRSPWQADWMGPHEDESPNCLKTYGWPDRSRTPFLPRWLRTKVIDFLDFSPSVKRRGGLNVFCSIEPTHQDSIIMKVLALVSEPCGEPGNHDETHCNMLDESHDFLEKQALLAEAVIVPSQLEKWGGFVADALDMCPGVRQTFPPHRYTQEFWDMDTPRDCKCAVQVYRVSQ